MQPTPPELTELVQQPLQLDGQQHVYGKQNLDHDDAQKPLKVRKTVWVAQASHVGRPDGGSGGSTDVDHHARLSNNAQKSKKPMQRINATQQPEFHQKHPAKVKAEPATIHHHPAQPHAGDSSSEEEDAAKSLVSIFNTPPVKPTKPGTPPHQQPPAPLQCEQAEEATEVQMPQSQGHQERKGSATEEPSGSAKVELQDLSPAPSKSPTPQAASTPVRPTSEHSHLAQLQQPHPPPHTQHLRHSQPQTQHCISEASKHSYYEHPEPLPLSQQHLAGVMPPAVIPVAAMQAWPGSTHPPPGHHMGHNTTLAAAFGAFPHAQAQAAAAAQARAHAQAHAALQQHLLQQQIHAQVAALQAAGVPANQISAALQVCLAARTSTPQFRIASANIRPASSPACCSSGP